MEASGDTSDRPVICFGEILWDFLPRGLFLGGAPFNVACHLAKLGRRPIFISAVGEDVLGDEALRRASALGVDSGSVARRRELPTGYVQVALDRRGDASYTIIEPVAWDRIAVGERETARAARASAVVFGSLAMRGEHNRRSLDSLLADCPGGKLMDVNLRPPYDDRERVLALAAHADLVKLNEDELRILADCPPATGLGQAAARLSELVARPRICVTRGAEGAFYCEDGASVSAAAPAVEVVDAVGAGDAFMASLVDSLVAGEITTDSNQWLARACAIGAKVASLDGATPDYTP